MLLILLWRQLVFLPPLRPSTPGGFVVIARMGGTYQDPRAVMGGGSMMRMLTVVRLSTYWHCLIDWLSWFLLGSQRSGYKKI
ncbi:hypothetical protein F4810DRAFT_669939 [Camillea tinctor]|nr:hypothetical protein F4810DRAFT_669939 [Camillea tinctor]